MRKRVIDPEIYDDIELIRLLKLRGLHFYIVLWCYAEDWGGYEPDYHKISLKTGALHIRPKDVEKYINLLIEKKKIIVYTTKTGRKIHWLKNLLKHQPLKNPAPPVQPLPDWIRCRIERFPSGKKYGVYKIITGRLPVDYQESTNSLPVIAKQKQKQKRNRNYKSGEEIGDAEGQPLYDVEKEKANFLKNKEHLESQCKILIEAFKNNGFNPIGFIAASVKAQIPVEVYMKVIDSMVRQKDKIKKPQAWIVSVLDSEKGGYYYNENLKKHLEVKKEVSVDAMKRLGESYMG